jgi:predicted permease
VNVASEIVFPVFGMVLVGYLAGRAGLLNEQANQGLFRYAFYVAIPGLLFHTMATTELPPVLPWHFLLAYYLGTLAAYVAGGWLSRIAFGSNLAGCGMAGFGAAYSNVVMVGIPLILAAFGEPAALPLFIMLSFHSPVLYLVAAFAIEAGRGHREQLRRIPLQTAAGMLRNPIILGIASGIACNRLGFALPAPIDSLLSAIGATAGGCALVSLGLSLSSYRLAGDIRESLAIALVKSLLHPLLVWLFATRVFGLEPLLTNVAVVIAALPTGVSVYMFARHYELKLEVITRTIVITSIIAAITVTALLGMWL